MKSQEVGNFPIAEREPSDWPGIPAPPLYGKVIPTVPSEAPSSNGSARLAAERKSEVTGQRSAGKSAGRRLLSDLSQIRAVAFCCDECQTVVTLPRIRWANSPEKCPNCGARWMSKPSPDSSLPEDDPTYVYRLVSAFREALQRLIGVKQTAVFHLLLEIGESSTPGECGPTVNTRKGKAHA